MCVSLDERGKKGRSRSADELTERSGCFGFYPLVKRQYNTGTFWYKSAVIDDPQNLIAIAQFKDAKNGMVL